MVMDKQHVLYNILKNNLKLDKLLQIKIQLIHYISKLVVQMENILHSKDKHMDIMLFQVKYILVHWNNMNNMLKHVIQLQKKNVKEHLKILVNLNSLEIKKMVKNKKLQLVIGEINTLFQDGLNGQKLLIKKYGIQHLDYQLIKLLVKMQYLVIEI